jgi:hypothetical protein
LKIKLNGRHFDITEAIEAESQAALNILTEHDFQDALKTGKALETVHTRGRGLIREGWWPAAPKLVLDQMALTSPGNHGWLFVFIKIIQTFKCLPS